MSLDVSLMLLAGFNIKKKQEVINFPMSRQWCVTGTSLLLLKRPEIHIKKSRK